VQSNAYGFSSMLLSLFYSSIDSKKFQKERRDIEVALAQFAMSSVSCLQKPDLYAHLSWAIFNKGLVSNATSGLSSLIASGLT